MVSENLKEWVKQKRKKGVSDERIKQSLEKTGHDPSIVDELENPFETDDSDVEPSENVFEASDEPESSESEEPDQTSPSSQESGSSNQSSRNEGSETQGSTESSSQLPGLPSFNLPSISISRKKLGAITILLVVLAGGAGIYSLMPFDTGFSPSNVVNSDSSNDTSRLEQLESKHSGCPDAGVRVQSVSSSNGKTTADVLVTRNKARVVLEVTKNGDMVGFSTKRLKGESQITVDAVGDQVELRPLGCEQFYSRRSY